MRGDLKEMPISAYVSTAELKDGYELQASVSAQVAVTYAKEYHTPGSGAQPGDRVEIVYVEEACAQRLVRPSWMAEDIAKRQRVAARARGIHSDAFGAYEDEEEADSCSPAAAQKRRFVVLDDDTMNDKKAKHARYPEEVAANPADNHIDVVYYMDCVCALLKQLMHKEEGAAAELRRFALAYKEHNQRSRGNRFFGPTNASAEGLPKLSHRRPEAPSMTKTRTLGGKVCDIADERKKTAKPGRVLNAAAAKPQGSLAAKLGRAAPIAPPKK